MAAVLLAVASKEPWMHGLNASNLVRIAAIDPVLIFLWPVVVVVLLYIGIFHIRIE
jgi:hypothetical protein